MTEPKYGVVLHLQKTRTADGEVFAAVNPLRPTRLSTPEEEAAFRDKNANSLFVLIADKATLMANALDLCEEDFDNALDLNQPTRYRCTEEA